MAQEAGEGSQLENTEHGRCWVCGDETTALCWVTAGHHPVWDHGFWPWRTVRYWKDRQMELIIRLLKITWVPWWLGFTIRTRKPKATWKAPQEFCTISTPVLWKEKNWGLDLASGRTCAQQVFNLQCTKTSKQATADTARKPQGLTPTYNSGITMWHKGKCVSQFHLPHL